MPAVTMAFPERIAIQPSTTPMHGTVRIPGSKSITNRALLLAGLADGTTSIEDGLFSDDTAYLAESLRRLGVKVDEDAQANRFVVEGAGGPFPAPAAELFVGNAGTAMRFLVAALAVCQGHYRIDGVPRMRQRPIEPLLDGLRQIGARAWSEQGNGCPPVVVEGAGLRGGWARLRGDLSSQYFSAMMMIGPLTSEGIALEVEGELVSRPFVDLTGSVMSAFGASAIIEDYRRIVIPGAGRYRACRYGVEPDATAASYFFAAAAVTGGQVRVEGLPPSSAQGDLRFVDVLERMGCQVRRLPNAVEVAGPNQLTGVDVNLTDISDTALTLAAIAPLASGPVTIRGIAHSRIQETDRVAAMASELRKLGVKVDERPDGWRIYPSQPKGGVVLTYDDHRLAMSLSVLGLRVPGIVIHEPGCVAKTFPEFFVRLGELAGWSPQFPSGA